MLKKESKKIEGKKEKNLQVVEVAEKIHNNLGLTEKGLCLIQGSQKMKQC